MLSRFCGLSLKVVRLAQIAQSKSSHSVPALIFSSQKSNYATEVSNIKSVPKTRSVEHIIKDMKRQIENKSRLTNADFQSLLTKLTTQHVNSTQALEILKCCSNARTDGKLQSPIVNGIWNALKKNSSDFKIQHYNCALQFFRDNNDAKSAQKIFDEMNAAGIEPDASSYQHLLSAYCKVGNIEQAIEILGMMDRNNMYINKSSFNNLVQCHIICGNMDAANETMASLEEAGFKINYHTLEALLMHHAKAGDLESIKKTFEMFKELDLELLNRDILKVMRELFVNGHTDKIEAMVPYFKPNIGMKMALESAITLFVEHKQSSIVPRILQSADGNVKGKVKHLIQEMVRCSTPEPELLKTIENIETMLNMTIENNFDLFKPALESSSEEIIRKLLAHMQSRSLDVSENVFEKLFQLTAKKGVDEVLNIVNLMCSEFKIQPQITFIRDVILPCLNVKENAPLAFGKLQTTTIRLRNVSIAIINTSLNNGDIKTAYDFARCTDQIFYGVEMVRRPLLRAFATNSNVTDFVSFVRLIHDSFEHIQKYQREKTFDDAEMKEMKKAFLDETLSAAISSCRTDTQKITKLLESFVEEGLTIGTKAAEKIQIKLQVDSESVIGRLLKRLSTETLELKPIDVQKRVPNIMNQLSSADVQNILEVKQAQGHSSAATEKLLFLAYIREGNCAEVESLLAKGKLTLSNSDYALLIELYTRLGNLENALNMLKRVCANNASFKLDRIKVSKLITLMIEKERDFSEVEAILQAHRQGKAEFRIFIFEHLLDRLAENSSVKLTTKLFDALLKYSYIEPTVESTGPLIACHLNNGNYAEAVDKYEYLSVTYNLVPMTMVLFVRLIRNNQIDLLQRAYDIFEKKNGDNAALCRLAFAFVECGRDRQARAILENDQVKNLSRYITRECKQYVTYGRIQAAKTLLEATKGLYCDRHVIYQAMLDIYKKTNNAQQALELWCDYSTEDGMLPKPQFQRQLGELLKANNMEIPTDLEYIQKTSTEKQTKDNLDQGAATN